MVDFLGMFRRRAPKRGPQGFARSPVDITALGDSMGDMLGSPSREAPALVRTAPADTPQVPQARAEAPRAPQPAPARRPDKAPRPRTNGAAAPKATPRAGYL